MGDEHGPIRGCDHGVEIGFCASASVSEAGRALIPARAAGLLGARGELIWTDGWPSGRRHSPAKRVWVKSPSRVRIPPHPPVMWFIALNSLDLWTASRIRPTRRPTLRSLAVPRYHQREVGVSARIIPFQAHPTGCGSLAEMRRLSLTPPLATHWSGLADVIRDLTVRNRQHQKLILLGTAHNVLRFIAL